MNVLGLTIVGFFVAPPWGLQDWCRAVELHDPCDAVAFMSEDDYERFENVANAVYIEDCPHGTERFWVTGAGDCPQWMWLSSVKGSWWEIDKETGEIDWHAPWRMLPCWYMQSMDCDKIATFTEEDVTEIGARTQCIDKAEFCQQQVEDEPPVTLLDELPDGDPVVPLAGPVQNVPRGP